MPELPEVENVRRSLAPVLIGATLRSCTILRADVCEVHDGTAPTPRHMLEGAKIVAINRRGKQLALLAHDGRTLCIHLGMTGSLELVADASAPHTHITWRVGPRTLAFRDPRRFGGLWPFESEHALLAARWSKLGPDALIATAEHLHESSRASTRAVKALLLDQSIIAGVGNIYADEALFASKLSPHTRAGRVKIPTWGQLVDNLRVILTGAIDAGGSTIRDYRGPTGEAGRAQRDHKVYGRAGEPCVCCERPLSSGAVGQRTTVWCGHCQKRS